MDFQISKIEIQFPIQKFGTWCYCVFVIKWNKWIWELRDKYWDGKFVLVNLGKKLKQNFWIISEFWEKLHLVSLKIIGNKFRKKIGNL